ncbi:Hypothetical protein, putative, partial [Bodo saltans]
PRPRHLNEGAEKEALAFVEKARVVGSQVTAATVASICRGVQQRECSALLVENGGVQAFSKHHAKCILQRHGYKPLGATTDRTMTDQSLLACGRSFFSALEEFGKTHNVQPKNVYNFDEFFVLLDRDSKRWSWHRASARHHVAVRSSKIGLTLGILTSADGELHLVQMNWHGATERCEAEARIPHPKILQTHSEDSHFQTAQTFNQFYHQAHHIALQRAEPTEDVLFLFDAAPQHKTAESLRNPRVHIMELPRGATHYFQPADQYIIPTFKAYITAAWEAWVQALAARFSAGSAIAIMYNSAAKIVRTKKYEFVCAAIEKMTSATVVNSWHVCGIIKALFNIEPPPAYRSYYDQLLGAADSEPTPTVIDVDEESDDEIEDGEVDANALQMMTELGFQGAPFPEAPEQRVDDEVPFMDPLIKVDHILVAEKRARGRPAKRDADNELDNEQVKQRHRVEVARVKSAMDARARFRIMAKSALDTTD